jgi:hypothetical protein
VVVPLPLPVLLPGALDGDVRLPELLDELLPELLELPLEPLLELPVLLPELVLLVPELVLVLPELVLPLPDPVEPADELVPVLVLLLAVVAWLEPGRITATAPTASTLAADADTVAAVSRRRPRSRAATACATRRALATSFPLFTPSVWHAPLDALSGKHLSLF